MLDRRQFLKSGAALATLPGVAACDFLGSDAAHSAEIVMQDARFNLLPGFETENLVSALADAPPPILRAKQGVPFTAKVTNQLTDYTTMHWHGVRLKNAMDGVPYLTQFPMQQGETFDYTFTPADAGTYWYHPHCLTMELMARGLTGALIVEEAEDPGFDEDLVINLRDFRLNDEGQFTELYTARGAARAGTFGNVMTANWLQDPVYEAPAGGLVRLRLIATDTTRIYRLFLGGAAGKIIAFDGHPLVVPLPWPSGSEPLILSPGQRADIALEVPASEGQEVSLLADVAGGPKRLARVRTVGTSRNRQLAELKPLAPNPVPEPDLANADLHEFVFGWSPDGDLPNDGLCGTMGYTFWSINRTPWPGDASGTGPLATLDHGKSYIIRLRNESPNEHPIHLHGLAFKPIRSNRREIASNWTDTALLLKQETLDIAFVADNPGDWAFHCHVIEHQKTGLAGYIRIA